MSTSHDPTRTHSRAAHARIRRRGQALHRTRAQADDAVRTHTAGCTQRHRAHMHRPHMHIQMTPHFHRTHPQADNASCMRALREMTNLILYPPICFMFNWETLSDTSGLLSGLSCNRDTVRKPVGCGCGVAGQGCGVRSPDPRPVNC
jgi:hypothetical protein